MAWTVIDSKPAPYGTMYFEYDNSDITATPHCRLRYNSGSNCISGNFYNVTIGSRNFGTVQVNGCYLDISICDGNFAPGWTTWSIDWNYSKDYSGGGTIPSLSSPPTGLAVSSLSSTDTSISGTVSVSGWGSGITSYRKELQVWTYSASGLVEPRRYAGNSSSELSSVITVNNQSSSGTLTLVPNTEYVIGGYASNGAADTGNKRLDTAITKPAALVSKTATKVSDSMINIHYVTGADGGRYPKTIQYSFDGDVWVDGDTVTSSSSYSGSFNVENASGGSLTVYLRVRTSAGATPSGSVTFFEKGNARWTYGSIEEKSRDILKMYASVNDETIKVSKIYASENGKTKLICQFFS